MNATRTALAVGAVVVGLILTFTPGEPAHPNVIGWAVTGFLAVMFVLDMRESWAERREAIEADRTGIQVLATRLYDDEDGKH